jgi:hypothetical protein
MMGKRDLVEGSMDNDEAMIVLEGELEKYRKKTYWELVELMGEIYAYEKEAYSGRYYQVEIQLVWDLKQGGDLRVIGSIDDGGWRAFFPLTHGFLMNPDDQIVGE